MKNVVVFSILVFLVVAATHREASAQNFSFLQVLVNDERFAPLFASGLVPEWHDLDVRKNRLTMTAGSVASPAAGQVGMGGAKSNRTVGAMENIVLIQGGIVYDNVMAVYGAQTDSGRASDNSVSLQNGWVGPIIYGGYSARGLVDYNRVSVTGGTAAKDIYGGWGTAIVEGNSVTVTGGSVGGNIYGGSSSTSAVANRVYAANMANPFKEIYGGIIRGGGNGSTDRNTVELYNSAGADFVVGGQGMSGAAFNKVKIGNVSGMLGAVYGGRIDVFNAGTGSADDNTVELHNASVMDDVVGGLGGSGASRNSVSISGTGWIHGSVTGGATTAGAASYNNVTIYGGTIDNNVYGGASDSGDATSFNTVTLIGGSIGGGVFGGNNADKTGNTLNLHGYLGSVDEINNFANYSVILSDSVSNGGTQIHIKDNATDLSGARITDFSFAPGVTRYEAGDRMTIIDSTFNDGSFQDITFNSVAKGVTAAYDVLVSGNGGALTASIAGKKSGDHSENINEGKHADIALLNKGSSLLTRAGLDRAWRSDACTDGGAISVFGVSDYDDFSVDGAMDMNAWSLLTGIGWRSKRDCTTGLLLGLFFETGSGRYDGSSFYDTGAVDYSGTAEYYGGGLLARYCFPNRLRLDGSVRVGRQEMDYRASRYPGGQLPEYSLASGYVGLHGSIGYDLDFADRWNLDLSAMYQWIRLGDDSATVLGEQIDFDSTQSHLVRAGGRVSYAVTPQIKPFIGAYYEYEFGGSSRSYNRTAKLANNDFKTEGGSGLGELGVGFVPVRGRDLAIELAAKGSVGHNRGVGGQISFTWNF